MTAAPEIPADVMAAAREALAVEYERTEYGGGPYPTYADLARSGSGSFTLCSIRAIARAILAERERCVDVVRAEAKSWLDMNFQHEYLGAMHAARAIQGPTT